MAKGLGRRWTEEEYQHLARIAHGRKPDELAELMSARFQQPYTAGQIKAAMGRRRIRNGRDGRFPPGHRSWNTGRTGGPSLSPGTCFKKGNRPQTWRPVGTESLRADGYTWVKVAEPRSWRLKHRLVWEEAHGPVPRGYAVVFLNQDRQDFRLENLALVSRGRLAVANKQGLLYACAEMTKTGLLIADVRMQASRRKREG